MGIVFSDIAVSADGFATGLNQREEAPFGDIDENWLHGWMFDTPTRTDRGRRHPRLGRNHLARHAHRLRPGALVALRRRSIGRSREPRRAHPARARGFLCNPNCVLQVCWNLLGK